jgi:hypothetical protein
MSGSALRLVELGLPCNVCKETKPNDAFYIDNRQSTRHRQNRSYVCKVCFVGRRRRYETLPNDHPDMVAGRRTCNECSVEKPLFAFPKDRKDSLGRGGKCADCKNARRRALRVRNPKIRMDPTKRDYNRRHRLGASSATFKALFDAHGGRCGICRSELDFLSKDTHLDHSHKTGMLRGVLCARCNHGIGHFKDDPRRLRAAISYLEKHGET